MGAIETFSSKHLSGERFLILCDNGTKGAIWFGLIRIYFITIWSRVAQVVRRHEGPLPKTLDSDENFKP